MAIPFFRKKDEFGELNLFPDTFLEDTTQIVTNWQDAVVSNIPSVQSDPVRKATYLQIGIVSVDNKAQLPALLNDVTRSNLIQRIDLPRNPRIADNELYELDGMDFIVMLTSIDKRINKDLVRWLKRLKHLQIPMLVLLPYPIEKRREQHQIDLFSQHVGVPFISVTTEDTDIARAQFVQTTMHHMPAMSLALAAHLPSFRQPLVENLVDVATLDSLVSESVQELQLQLVRQMCAAHGFDERDFEKNHASLDTLVKTTRQFTDKLVGIFPIRKGQRRTRFSNAVCTLLLGYATTMYLGGNTPSLRKDLIPQIWRLYRASKKPIST